MAYQFDCELLVETGESVKVLHCDSGEEVWIPRSAVIEIDVDLDYVGTITVEDWVAREKGLTEG